MPSSFSREPGSRANPGAGMTSAASGIQVWNGNMPALAPAPRKISTKEAKATQSEPTATCPAKVASPPVKPR